MSNRLHRIASNSSSHQALCKRVGQASHDSFQNSLFGASAITVYAHQRRWLSTTRRVSALPPPPPLPPSGRLRHKAAVGLPPPPPLSSAHLTAASGAGATHSPSAMLRTPQDVLAAFISLVPTYYVSVPCVASMLPDELRECFIGRNRLSHFLTRYPFLFDVQSIPGAPSLVRLHRDVSHPQRGSADEKFMMTDVGEKTSYVVKPEYIVSTENLETLQGTVYVTAPVPPPAVRVHLEERVPVVERLRTLVPDTFVSIEELEETIPEDVLFHPYFDCQGGLLSIAGKLPEEFQVVEGCIRRRPRHLAPLALGEYTLENSPLPDVAAMVKREVCTTGIPHWVKITPLYEQLTREQKHHLRQQFKSFAGFLRAHGRSLAVSNDMLQVSMWICVNPPPQHAELPSGMDAAAAQEALPTSSFNTAPASPRAVTYTREEVLNALYDRFPPHKTLNLREAMELLPVEMRTSGLPTKIAPWLATHPHYFSVDFMEENDPAKVLVRRASERQPLDLATALYAHMPRKDQQYEVASLLHQVDPAIRRVIEDVGVEQLGEVLPQWLRVTKKRNGSARATADASNFTMCRLQEHEALQSEVQRRAANKKTKKKKTGDTVAAEVADAVDAEDLANLPG